MRLDSYLSKEAADYGLDILVSVPSERTIFLFVTSSKPAVRPTSYAFIL
jgi:hypothetical protein